MQILAGNVTSFPGNQVGNAADVVTAAMRTERSMFLGRKAFAVEHGPSGGPELICCLGKCSFSDVHYWYGHIRRHPEKNVFASCIVMMSLFVDGRDADHLFASFDHWTRIRLQYEPARGDGFGEIYRESGTFKHAVMAMAEMVSQNVKAAWPEDAPPDFRILNLYGLENYKDSDGVYPDTP
jgi:hypothetical protein